MNEDKIGPPKDKICQNFAVIFHYSFSLFYFPHFGLILDAWIL